jgi:hypothetical protein
MVLYILPSEDRMQSNPFTSYTLLLALILLFAACQNKPAAENSQSTAPSQTATPVAPTLAKAKITEATAAAKNWKPDAALIQIAKGRIGDDGKAIMWDYGYWSAAAKTCAVVNVSANGASSVRESGGESCEAPELKDFMDSDQAVRIARDNGVKAATVTMIAATAPRSGASIWTIMDDAGMKAGNVMLDIDANTGNVLNTTSQK